MIATAVDPLRPPLPLEAAAAAYKDWLHVNVFDHASGAVGLVNVSLHGSPWDPASRVVGTGLLQLPGEEWVGGAIVRYQADARVGTSSLAVDGLAIAVDPTGRSLAAAAHLPGDGLSLEVAAAATAPRLHMEQRFPFGHGWISWSVVPRLAVTGRAVLAGRVVDLGSAVGYHDHNWGRWHWGDDFGWDWGAFVAEEPGPTIVVSRATDRARRACGPAMLTVDVAGGRRTFRGAAVSLRPVGRFAGRLRRVPGALAVLHQDRLAPALPSRLLVVAGDGVDELTVDFRVRAAAQLLAADPTRRGYGFVHEMVGEFEVAGRLHGDRLAACGLAVVEHVD